MQLHICVTDIQTVVINLTVQAKNILVQITEKFRYVKCEFYYNMNIIKIFNIITLLLLLVVQGFG